MYGIMSAKKIKYLLKENQADLEAYYIISTSYDVTASFNGLKNKIVLNYDDNLKDFDTAKAEQIKVFVENVPINAIIYFVCDEGISRSSAIACAVLRAHGGDEFDIWSNPQYTPNIHVYDIMCKAYEINNTRQDLEYRQAINRNSLHSAIMKARNP